MNSVCAFRSTDFSASRSALILFFCFAVHCDAGEALWPIESRPAEEIQKDWGFAPDGPWFDRVAKCCVKIANKTKGGRGTAVFVSPKGLLLTNRHVVLDTLARHSTPDRDLVHNGFNAASQPDELPCDDLEIQMLLKAVDMTADVHKDLGPNPGNAEVGRYAYQLEQTMRKEGARAQLVSMYGGAQYWGYIYVPYDVRLVFAPDEALARFGGEFDNFTFPRHSLDVAFLRAYRNGKEAQTSCFPLASPSQGVVEGDPVFIAGFPGKTERYLPSAQLEYLRDIELPLRVATAQEGVNALAAYIEGGELQKKVKGEWAAWANQLKLYQGTLQFLKSSDFVTRRAIQEQIWQKDIEALPAARGVNTGAFKDVKSACGELAKNANTRHFSALPPTLFFVVVNSVKRLADVTRGKPETDVQRQAKGFSAYVKQILDPAQPIDLGAERATLSAWFSAAQKNLKEDDVFLQTALKGQSPADAAGRILADAEALIQLDSLNALALRGGDGIDAAKIPVLQFVTELATQTKPLGSSTGAARRDQVLEAIQRALFAAYSNKLLPDAAATLRLGWGRVSGYKINDTQVEWCTTFSSMIERAEHEQRPAYALSEPFKRAQSRLVLATPLDFVSTVDGAPGSSGAPLFTREGRLVGLVFDGNLQETPSIYSYISPETGGRSIAVHTAAIWAALDQIYDAKAILEELRAAGLSNDSGTGDKK